MSDKEVDDLIVNLKVLSGLEQNKKLITKETFLNVEQYTFGLPEFVKRWHRGDSRDETIKKIDNIITKSIDFLPNNPNLSKFIEDAKKGILNLKETYTSCNQTKARLDTIIVKIDRIKRDSSEFSRSRADSIGSDGSMKEQLGEHFNFQNTNDNRDV